RSKRASATSSTESRSRPPSSPRGRRAKRRPAHTPAASRLEQNRAGIRIELGRLVLGEAALHDGAREDADEAASLLDDGHALEVVLLERSEAVVERERAIEREVRRLGDLAQPYFDGRTSGGDNFAHEGLAREHADQ